MDGFTIAWLLWGAMFIVVETPALLNRQVGDTLSEHVWRWFSVKEKATGWRWRRGVLAIFMGWLSLHFLLN